MHIWMTNLSFFFKLHLLLISRWSANSSAVLPDDETEPVVYVVGVLRSANPATCSTECLNDLRCRHGRVVRAAAMNPRIGAKQYLAHHASMGQWRAHFGRHWERFMARKVRFDPLSILAPGQGIFPRIYASSL